MKPNNVMNVIYNTKKINCGHVGDQEFIYDPHKYISDINVTFKDDNVNCTLHAHVEHNNEFKIKTDYKFNQTNKTKYIIIMFDPDAPQRGKNPNRSSGNPGLFWLHWLNINGIDHVQYYPPTPPKNTGLHRYFICLYKTDNKITEQIKHTGHFDVIKFIEKLEFVDMRMFRVSHAPEKN
jgi:phosphatidylethanolamine-binding protein (PEBP) family uncharacterized protein